VAIRNLSDTSIHLAESGDTLITVSELARRLKVPKSWVYDRTRQGGPDHLPHYRLGKYVRFSITEVLAHIRKEEDQSPS
jgi:excisionase family DNA binding protein